MSRAQQLVVNLRGFTRGPGHPDLQGIWRDNMRDAADELERLDAIIQHLTVAVCVVCDQGHAVWTGSEYRHPGCKGPS